MGQAHILTGPERRRRWTAEQKRAIVAAAFAPGAVVVEVARHADVCAGQIYRWRRDLRAAVADFAEVMMVPAVTPAAALGGDAIELVLAGGAQIRVPAGTAPELAAAVIRAVAGR
ncbi:transposase [Magnetospirillum moscoviense]|uniref:Transposase n=2 Tax=Magnetospirillum moscoviense TaxID=1437059 RepID=A0A178MZF7_9PROT|nr:transposase [Magnetospirillum moscoviense]MBF0323430.1 transposase [Alphaproteobacteria bacterium]OAN63727.1 transposase [Magnetospirillum moscoviense]